MAISVNNNYLTTLIDAGADAYSNMYEAALTFGSESPVKALAESEGNSRNMTVRITDFQIPTPKQEEYQVKYVTATISRPAAKVTVDKKVTIKFRVDANYAIYKALLEQQKVTSFMSRNFASWDFNSIRNKLFSMKINVLTGIPQTVFDADTKVETMFEFKDCWITKIDPLPFAQGDASAMEVSVDINFLEMRDLQTKNF